MKEFTYVIQDPMGIHARPAGQFVKEAGAFADTAVTIGRGGKEVDAKRILGVMSLGVKQGEEVTIKCDGPDEDAAAEKLEAFLKENM